MGLCVSVEKFFSRTRFRHVRIDGYRLLSNTVRTFVSLSFFFLRFARPSAFVVFRRNVLRLSRQCKCARKRGTERLKRTPRRRTKGSEKDGKGEGIAAARETGCRLRANCRYTCAIWSVDIYTTLYHPFRMWTMGHEASHREFQRPSDADKGYK